MERLTTYVGLDVHKETIAVALADGGKRGEVREHGKNFNTAAALAKLASKLVEDAFAKHFYPDVSPAGVTLVWATWRKPTHDELIKAWPAHWSADTRDRARGWWQPTIEELRIERRKAASSERTLETRRATHMDQ